MQNCFLFFLLPELYLPFVFYSIINLHWCRITAFFKKSCKVSKIRENSAPKVSLKQYFFNIELTFIKNLLIAAVFGINYDIGRNIFPDRKTVIPGRSYQKNMDRRSLIRQLMLGLPAGLIIPSLFSACSEKDLIGDGAFKGKVLIIGGGVAGIYAASLLSKYGVQVTVLEAAVKTGGRIASVPMAGGDVVETGAEVIRGDKSIFNDLIRFVDPADVLSIPGNNYYLLQSQLRTEDYLRNAGDLQGAGETFFQILDSFASYPGENKSVEDYLIQFPLDPRFTEIAEARIGNRFGTSNQRLGTLAMKESEAGFTAGKEEFTLKSGNLWDIFEKAFPEVIANVVLNSPVKKIDYSGATVNITTTNNTVYTADKVLVTVPLGVLKAGIIEFSPLLSGPKQEAVTSIGLDNCIKIVLKFIGPFWQSDAKSILGALHIPEYRIYSAGKDNSANTLTATVTGEKAELLSAMSDGEIQAMALAELTTLHLGQGVVALFQQIYVKRWGADPLIRGGWSYPSLSGVGQKEVLAEPVNQKLFFAGEATNTNGHSGTIHGAMESAYRAAIEILEQ